jgi:hypothetical protein
MVANIVVVVIDQVAHRNSEMYGEIIGMSGLFHLLKISVFCLLVAFVWVCNRIIKIYTFIIFYDYKSGEKLFKICEEGVVKYCD